MNTRWNRAQDPNKVQRAFISNFTSHPAAGDIRQTIKHSAYPGRLRKTVTSLPQAVPFYLLAGNAPRLRLLVLYGGTPLRT